MAVRAYCNHCRTRRVACGPEAVPNIHRNDRWLPSQNARDFAVARGHWHFCPRLCGDGELRGAQICRAFVAE